MRTKKNATVYPTSLEQACADALARELARTAQGRILCMPDAYCPSVILAPPGFYDAMLQAFPRYKLRFRGTWIGNKPKPRIKTGAYVMGEVGKPGKASHVPKARKRRE